VSNKPLKWIVPVALVALALLAVLFWWAAGYWMTRQAEVKVQETLRGFEWEDKVKWDDFHVSPLAVATFNQVRFEVEPQVYLGIEQVRISDVLNRPDHQRINLQLKQVKPLFENDGATQQAIEQNKLPKNFLNPADMDLQLDLNFASNQGQLIFASQQKEVADFELKLNLSQIGALRGVLGAVFPQSAAASMELDPDFTGLNRLAATYSISLDSLDSRFKNHGFIEQLTSELKQQLENIPNNPGAGSIEQAREEAFVEMVQEVQESCHQGEQALRQPCQTLADFVLGKQDSLHLTAKPDKPVSLEQFDTVINSGKVPAVVKLLNINLK